MHRDSGKYASTVLISIIRPSCLELNLIFHWTVLTLEFIPILFNLSFQSFSFQSFYSNLFIPILSQSISISFQSYPISSYQILLNRLLIIIKSKIINQYKFIFYIILKFINTKSLIIYFISYSNLSIQNH